MISAFSQQTNSLSMHVSIVFFFTDNRANAIINSHCITMTVLRKASYSPVSHFNAEISEGNEAILLATVQAHTSNLTL
jgi:hypothetical protein